MPTGYTAGILDGTTKTFNDNNKWYEDFINSLK